MSKKPKSGVAPRLPVNGTFSTVHGQEPCEVALDLSVSGIAPLIRQQLMERLPEIMTAKTAVLWLNNRKKSWRRLRKSGAGPKPVTRVRKRDEPLQYARDEVVDALMRCLFCMPEPPSRRA